MWHAACSAPAMLSHRNTEISKPNLFTRNAAVRLSLLVSLGLLPGACGGSSSNPSAPGGIAGGAGASSQPGAAGSGAGVSGSNAGVGGRNAGAGGSSAGAGGGNAGSNNAGAPAQGGAAGHASAGAPGQGGSPGCVSPHLDAMTGLTVCGNGVEHRPSPVACTYSGSSTGGSGGSGGANEPTAGAGGQGIMCATDKDCAGIKYGYCQFLNGQRSCRSGCVQDSDCQAKQFCLCSGPGLGGTCVDTHCAVDADCGSGSLCAVTGNGCAPTTLACTDPADECTLDKDCTKGHCAVLLDSHRVCTDIVCSSGTTH